MHTPQSLHKNIIIIVIFIGGGCAGESVKRWQMHRFTASVTKWQIHTERQMNQ